jgi:hypothetical protein
LRQAVSRICTLNLAEAIDVAPVAQCFHQSHDFIFAYPFIGHIGIESHKCFGDHFESLAWDRVAVRNRGQTIESLSEI